MYTDEQQLYIAHSENGPINLIGKMANRHGLIAGATGTGKTVTLQVIAESFSQAGVPCFMADMKGDLSGISQAGAMSSFIEKRCPEFGISNPQFHGCPTRFFDVFGEQGYPMRATISSMGPQLLSRLMQLNETQAGVLNAVFRIADDNDLLLIDLKDLRLMLDFVGKNASKFTTEYGNIASASIGAIQRAVLQLESEGGDKFFGEPEFNIEDLFAVENGKGVMNVLAADKLMLNPKLYSTFLLWLMTELYSRLPEVGDLELPKLVFFFDEAHMLFDGTSKALVDKIEQVIRLIRSKGVGIYFITQVPSDVPANVLAQLGNRVQHALRAFTPQDQKAVRAAAQTFRANPAFKTEEAIMDLATGEALVSFLDEKGSPSVVERAKILFPLSQIGAITAGQRLDIQDAAPDNIKEYQNFVDRESAYEVLTEVNQQLEEAKQQELQAIEEEKALKAKEKEEAKAAKEKEKKEKKNKGIKRTILGTMIGAAASSFARSIGTQVAKNIGGSKKTTKSKSSKKSDESVLGKAAKKAAQTATSTATRKITEEILKGILK
ncbi:MAG: DUF853 domain-containing protein [Bacteroidales bacterium]|nr:DUF853 domain-containing protein [Bacteroidales bacterium]